MNELKDQLWTIASAFTFRPITITVNQENNEKTYTFSNVVVSRENFTSYVRIYNEIEKNKRDISTLTQLYCANMNG